jgi:hypothetical protein
MSNLERYINDPEIQDCDPLIKMAIIHFQFESIHPFYDGNGRMARILTNLILISTGYPPFWIRTEERSLYMQYLADIQGYGGPSDLFYSFAGSLILRSQQLVLAAIEGKDIDDPSDVDKEIAILVKRASSTKAPSQPRSMAFIQTLYHQFARDLLQQFVDKHHDLVSLFASYHSSFGIAGRYNNSIEWLDEELARIASTKSAIKKNEDETESEDDTSQQIQHLTASIELKELKASANSFRTQSYIDFNFSLYSYKIRTVRKTWNFNYIQMPESNLIHEIVTDGVRALLEEIESQLK